MSPAKENEREGDMPPLLPLSNVHQLTRLMDLKLFAPMFLQLVQLTTSDECIVEPFPF